MIRKIGIVAWPNKTVRLLEALDHLRQWSKLNPQVQCLVHESLKNIRPGFKLATEQELRKCQALLAIGGDGTMLSAARIATGTTAALLGVNTGRLGFLAEARLEDLHNYLNALIVGDYKVAPRLMLDYSVHAGRKTLLQDTILNEVQIQAVEPARMVDLEVSLDGKILTEFWADSLLISTPTGSTAYNLSAGGPILHPSTDAFILNPVNPFSLSVRPLVLAASSSILTLRELNGQPLRIVGDGKAGPLIEPGQVVRLRKSKHLAHFVDTRAGFEKALREKLGWTGKPQLH